MNTPALILVAVLASAATGAAVNFALAPASERPVEAASSATPDAASASDVASLREELSALSRALEEQRLDLGARIDALSRRPLTGAAPSAAAGQPGEAALALSGGTTEAAGGALAGRSAAELFELFQDGSLSDMAEAELWSALARAGRTKELVDLYEAKAQQHPNDPDVQVELASAYIQMIQEVGNSPLAATWATKADQAYDRALEFDPTHVEARFSKAIALSFWPSIAGKQPVAVKQFELLIDQLEGQPLQPEYAQAWVMLGNLHAQAGKDADALAVWQQGAALFPDDATLGDKAKAQ